MPVKPVIITPGDEHPDLATAKPAVCIVIQCNDKYLGVRSKKRGYRVVLPGGSIDPGEDSFDAARRELFEETGYKPPLLHFCGFAVLHTGSDGVTYLTDVYSYLLDADEPVPTPQSQEPEKEVAVWTTFEELAAGPYGDVYDLGLLQRAMAYWHGQHPGLVGLTDTHTGVIAQYLQGVTPKELQEKHPELALKDQEVDRDKMIRNLMVLNENLTNANAALKMRVDEYESGEEIARLKGFWSEDQATSESLRAFIRDFFEHVTGMDARGNDTFGHIEFYIGRRKGAQLFLKHKDTLMGLLGPLNRLIEEGGLERLVTDSEYAQRRLDG